MSAALFTNPQGPSASQRSKKKKPNCCTNVKCKYRHTHNFKDCRSKGGPQHATNLLPVRKPQQNSTQGQNRPQNQGGRNASQIMQANVAQDKEPIDHAFATVVPFSITDTAKYSDPSERVEIYDSGATRHMSPYIDTFTDFEFTLGARSGDPSWNTVSTL